MTKTMDVQVTSAMLDRTEIMFDGALKVGTGVSVQELLNAFCDMMDGAKVHDLAADYGISDELAERRVNMFNDLKGNWRGEDGQFVLGTHRNEAGK